MGDKDPDQTDRPDASAGGTGSATGADPREVFLSEFSKLWFSARDAIESFAKTYFSPEAEEKQLSGPAWLETNMDFATRMSMLWLEGMSLLVDRSVTMAIERLQSGHSEANGPGAGPGAEPTE